MNLRIAPSFPSCRKLVSLDHQRNSTDVEIQSRTDSVELNKRSAEASADRKEIKNGCFTKPKRGTERVSLVCLRQPSLRVADQMIEGGEQ